MNSPEIRSEVLNILASVQQGMDIFEARTLIVGLSRGDLDPDEVFECATCGSRVTNEWDHAHLRKWVGE